MTESGVPEARRARKGFLAALILPLALYGALAARRIGAGIGYQMDEALYVESAVYVLADGRGEPPFAHDPAFFATAAGRHWPLMIFPYVGAAKAWVALPLFAVLGTSAEVARWSGVLLGGLGIGGLAWLVATQASPAAAFYAALALAIHPAYLDLTVFDHGGTSVGMGAMGLVALALARFLRRRSAFSAFLLGVAAGLGVWARLNFAWLVGAAVLAVAIVVGRQLRPAVRELAAAAGGAVVGAAPLILYEIASRGATLPMMALIRQPASAARYGARLSVMAELMISARQLRGIWGGPGRLGWEVGLGAALFAAVLAAALWPARESGGVSALRRAFAWTALLLAGIMAVTRLPVGQHHMAAILPPAFASLAILAVERSARAPKVGVAAAAAGLALATVWLCWDVRIERGLRVTGGRGVWSNALAEVGRDIALRKIPRERLKILDWGFQNNLYVLSGGVVAGTEIYWGATTETSSRGLPWGAEVRDGGAFLFLEGDPESPAVEGFRGAIAGLPDGRTETVYRGRTGVPAVRLVEIASAR